MAAVRVSFISLHGGNRHEHEQQSHTSLALSQYQAALFFLVISSWAAQRHLVCMIPHVSRCSILAVRRSSAGEVLCTETRDM